MPTFRSACARCSLAASASCRACAARAEEARAAELAAEEQVLGDGHGRRHGQVLVHRLDAGAARVDRAAEVHGCAVEQDLAVVGHVAPDSALISDDLPAPLSPITARISPARSSKSAPSSAVTWP
jgi:hypothetical protein